MRISQEKRLTLQANVLPLTLEDSKKHLIFPKIMSIYTKDIG